MVNSRRFAWWVYVAQIAANLMLFGVMASLVLRRHFLGKTVYFYDVYASSLCALVVGQVGVMACWNALLEPRSALRWIYLLAVMILASTTSAIAYYCAFLRFGYTDEVEALFGALGVFGGATIAAFSVLFISRIVTWPVVYFTSLHLECGQTRASMAAHRFSLQEYFYWISAIAVMLWCARAIFDTMYVGVLVVAGVGFFLATPIFVPGMLTGLKPSRSRVVLLVLAVLLATVVEITLAWYLPVSWKTFAWSALLFNALLATTVQVNFSILHALGLRLVQTKRFRASQHEATNVGSQASTS